MPENKNDIDLGTWTLHRTASENRPDIARALIEHGAEVSEMDPNSWTPLQWAAWSNSPDVVRILIDNSADVNVKGKNSWTPLHYAAQENSPDVAHQLIEKGANTHGIDLSWMEDDEDA